MVMPTLAAVSPFAFQGVGYTLFLCGLWKRVCRGLCTLVDRYTPTVHRVRGGRGLRKTIEIENRAPRRPRRPAAARPAGRAPGRAARKIRKTG